MKTKIVQFAVPFSPNLGDGIMSDCLAFALDRVLNGIELTRVDLSGRRDFGDVTVRHRAFIIWLFGYLPAVIRKRLVRSRLEGMLDQFTPEWQEAVDGADLAVIGGGQLFQDADLNFCLKIARASEILAKAEVPTVIHSAGVARNWTAEGAALFAKILQTDLRMVGLRDANSLSAWRDQIAKQFGAAESPSPELTRDLGLLSASCYGAVDGSDRIGICVTAPEILAYHGDGEAPVFDGQLFYADLARVLHDRGHRVALFCNGAVEDRPLLRRLAERPDIQALTKTGRLEVLAVPSRPKELGHMIGGFKAVVAHRLHATIIGYSYGVPVIGLGWDKKVESFFASVGLRDFFLAADELEVFRIVEMIECAIAEGIDPGIHAGVVGETWRGLQRALNSGFGRTAGSVDQDEALAQRRLGA